MKERDNYMLCCDCGLAVKKTKMFIKKYQNTAVCLCRKCAVKLCTEIANSELAKAINKSLEQAKEIGNLKAEVNGYMLEPRKRTALDGKVWWCVFDTSAWKWSTLWCFGKYKSELLGIKIPSI